jgi:hypothetical protein
VLTAGEYSHRGSGGVRSLFVAMIKAGGEPLRLGKSKILFRNSVGAAMVRIVDRRGCLLVGSMCREDDCFEGSREERRHILKVLKVLCKTQSRITLVWLIPVDITELRTCAKSRGTYKITANIAKLTPDKENSGSRGLVRICIIVTYLSAIKRTSSLRGLWSFDGGVSSKIYLDYVFLWNGYLSPCT